MSYRQSLSRLFHANEGNIVLVAALAFPALAIVALGAVDVGAVMTDRTKMQGIADSAALQGARQLIVDTTSTTASRAKSFAQTQLANLGGWNPSVDAQILNHGKTMQVTISGSRSGIFNGILPSDGWHLNVSATASLEGDTPLCVLVSGTTPRSVGLGGKSAVADLKNNSQINAPYCMVQSNQDLDVEAGAQVNAGQVQAVGSIKGYVSPSPRAGAPVIADPFSNIDVSVSGSCADTNFTVKTGRSSLPPGVHCGTITIGGTATLILQPGEHYFYSATLNLTGEAVLQGSDVVLIFDPNSHFKFTWNSDIELEGRQSGPLAGFVVVATRGNNNAFIISTTAAHKLLGVVYVPNGLLDIQGKNKVAEASAWTIIVTKGIAITGFANLMINSNYGAGVVPVPAGVGPGAAAQVQLDN